MKSQKNSRKSRVVKPSSATRVVHVAIPVPVFVRLSKMAHKAERTINWTLRSMIEKAVAGRAS